MFVRFLFLIFILYPTIGFGITKSGDLFPFLVEWSKIINCKHLPPDLVNSSLLLPNESNAYQPSGIVIQLRNNSDSIGSILLSDDGKNVIGFSYKYRYHEIISPEIDKANAKSIAMDFVRTLKPKFVISNIIEPKTIDNNGNYSFEMQWCFEDFVTEAIFIDIDYNGFIVSYHDVIFISDMKQITKSPGKDIVQNTVKKYINERGYSIEEFFQERCLVNNEFKWLCVAHVQQQNEKYILDLEYDEQNNNCILLKKEKNSDVLENKEKMVVNAECPVFCKKNKEIWWVENVRWKRFPYWKDNPPTSLISYNTNQRRVYRPLFDKDLSIDYSNPSISSDCQWMAYTIQDNLLFNDLINNRVYIVKKHFLVNDRVSWSSDSKQIALTDCREKKAYVINLIGRSGIPLDDKESLIHINGDIIQIEFAPNINTMLYCLIHTKESNNDTNKLISYDLNTKKETLITNLAFVPYRMHLMPNGTNIIIVNSNNAINFDIKSNKISVIKWIDEHKIIDDKYSIKYSQFDWDIVNGDKMVFTAYTKEKDQVICIADIDGKNIIQISQNDHSLPLDRYMVNDIYSNVPKDQLSNLLLERMFYTRKLEWEMAPPPGPWDRK